jgi:hypothetical protein
MSYLDIIEKEQKINGKIFSCNLITKTENSGIFTDIIDEFIKSSSLDKSFLGIDLELIMIRKEPKQDITLMQLCFENDKYKKIFMLTKNVVENCKSKIAELLIAGNITKLVWGGVADIKIIKHYILDEEKELLFMNNLYDIQYLADIIFKINYFNKKCDEENEKLFKESYTGETYDVYKQPRSLFNCLNYYNIISDDIFNTIEYKEIDFKNLSKILSSEDHNDVWSRTYIYCMADVLYLTELFTFIKKNIGDELASECRNIQYFKEKDENRILKEVEIIAILNKENKFELIPETEKTDAWKKITTVKICLDYKNGICERGDKCKFAHIKPYGDEESKSTADGKRKSKRRSKRRSKRKSQRKSKRKSQRKSKRKSMKR